MQIFKKQREEGQGLVEYALVLVLVAVAIIIILTLLGESVVKVYAQAVGGLNGQSLTNSGVEFMYLGGDTSISQPGPNTCNISITDATIFMVENGVVSKNDTGNVPVTTGGSQSTMSISTNNVGLATVDITRNGVSCPSELSIGNTGHSVGIP